ncbi:hypothetical protein Tco_0088604 [Tanacetum coccineum]
MPYFHRRPYHQGFGAFAWRIPILVTISKTVLRHLKIFKGFKVQLGEDPIRAQWGGLRAEEELFTKMDFRSFMIQGVDDEFNFLPMRGLDENQSFTKSVNNEATYSFNEGCRSMIGPNAPSYLEEGKRSTVVRKRKVVVGSLREGPHRKARKVFAQASKVAGDASSPLDVNSDPDIHGKLDPSTVRKFPFAKELKDATDCHWVVAHVTPLSWKQYLREISIDKLCDIHDKAYMCQAFLDNVLNGRTQEMISALHKARASYDTMQEREIKKDKAYVELENKCNEALQGLDKNLLIFDMRAEIETLQSQSMASTEVDSLRQDRGAVVSMVISDAAMMLIHSDEMGVLIDRLGKSSIIYGRCTVFKEVAELKKPFVLEEMPGYYPSSKEEYDRAGNDLADASYPLLAELTTDPHAFMEQLLSKKPQSLQSKRLSLRARRDAECR